MAELADVPVGRDTAFISRHLAPKYGVDRSMFTRQEQLGVSYLLVPYRLHTDESKPPGALHV